MSALRIRGAAAAMVAVIVVAGTATAQVTPYQSQQREHFGTGPGQSGALPQGGVLEPRVEAALAYAANIELAPDGEPQVDMAGLEAAPGFYASYSSSTITSVIDYSLVGRAWEDSDFNDVSHRLAANGQWAAIPDWFAIRGQASYSDAVIDPRDSLNYGGMGIFGPGNLQEIAIIDVGPSLQHRFGSLDLLLEYSYGQTWFLDQGKGQPVEPVVGVVTNQDSVDESARFRFGTAETDSRLTAGAYYSWERSEFETALPYEYERAGLDAGFLVSRYLRLVGDVGVESDLEESTTTGGLDSDFWSAGFRWEPGRHSFAEARYGERFFGNSLFIEARYRARFLEFTAAYSEEPTVATRQLSLGDFDPGQLPPEVDGSNLGQFTSSPFVAKDARASVAAVGSRTRVRLSGFSLDREYIRGFQADEKGSGVSLDATRELGSSLSADGVISFENYEVTDFSADADEGSASVYDDFELLLRLNRSLGAHLTLSGEVSYLMRSAADDFDGWWVAIRARWTP